MTCIRKESLRGIFTILIVIVDLLLVSTFFCDSGKLISYYTLDWKPFPFVGDNALACIMWGVVSWRSGMYAGFLNFGNAEFLRSSWRVVINFSFIYLLFLYFRLNRQLVFQVVWIEFGYYFPVFLLYDVFVCISFVLQNKMSPYIIALELSALIEPGLI